MNIEVFSVPEPEDIFEMDVFREFLAAFYLNSITLSKIRSTKLYISQK